MNKKMMMFLISLALPGMVIGMNGSKLSQEGIIKAMYARFTKNPEVAAAEIKYTTVGKNTLWENPKGFQAALDYNKSNDSLKEQLHSLHVTKHRAAYQINGFNHTPYACRNVGFFGTALSVIGYYVGVWVNSPEITKGAVLGGVASTSFAGIFGCIDEFSKLRMFSNIDKEYDLQVKSSAMVGTNNSYSDGTEGKGNALSRVGGKVPSSDGVTPARPIVFGEENYEPLLQDNAESGEFDPEEEEEV